MTARLTLFFKSALLALAYCTGFLMLQFFLVHIDLLHIYPTEQNLCSWDAGLYKSIVDHGYDYSTNNTGFCVLFPLLWMLAGGTMWGGVILNALLFSAGFGVLNLLAARPLPHKLIMLSTPSLFFMLVPYSEALYFLLFALAVYGLVRYSGPVTGLSLLLLSCTRVTAITWVPALVTALLLAKPRHEWRASIRFSILWIILPVAAGLAIFLSYQYLKTGIWGAYFKTQATVWGHKANGIQFPLIDPYGGVVRVNWLNAAAFFTGISCLLITLRRGILWLTRKNYTADKMTTAALGYLGIIILTTLFYNPVQEGQTLSIGLHRYVFTSPAFMLLLAQLPKFSLKGWKPWIALVIFANVCWLAFGEYTHLQVTLFYNCLTLQIVAYALFFSKKVTAAGYVIFGLNLLLQVHLYQQFITPLYVD